MDVVSPAMRSRMMSGIRGKNTRPELIVRSVAHRLGLRFRLHREDLPGRPDVVFPKHRVALFVHGCFWHRHDCGLAAKPKTRPEFWETKFKRNVQRDAAAKRLLEEAGWRVVVVWECETRDQAVLRARLQKQFRLGTSDASPRQDGRALQFTGASCIECAIEQPSRRRPLDTLPQE